VVFDVTQSLDPAGTLFRIANRICEVYQVLTTCRGSTSARDSFIRQRALQRRSTGPPRHAYHRAVSGAMPARDRFDVPAGGDVDTLRADSA
jgi:hypothetical protein